MPGKRAKELKDATKEQAGGTLSNTRSALGKFTLDNTLPDAFVGLITEVLSLLARAAGRDSQAAGMTSSVTIMIYGVLTSWAYVGIVVFAFGALLFVYNSWRLVPAVNRYHKAAGERVGLYEDRDVPLWERD